MTLSEAVAATMSAGIRGLPLYVPDMPGSDYGYATGENGAAAPSAEGEEDYLGTQKVTAKLKKNPAGGVVRRHVPAGYNADVRKNGKPVKFNYKDNDLVKHWFK